jgi:hypothetical protein
MGPRFREDDNGVFGATDSKCNNPARAGLFSDHFIDRWLSKKWFLLLAASSNKICYLCCANILVRAVEPSARHFATIAPVLAQGDPQPHNAAVS